MIVKKFFVLSEQKCSMKIFYSSGYDISFCDLFSGLQMTRMLMVFDDEDMISDSGDMNEPVAESQSHSIFDKKFS